MIRINGNDYKLKITLGFWKSLSFSKNELETINFMSASGFQPERLFEVVKLAVFFGSKAEKGWHCLADMSKEISDENFDDIDDPELFSKIDQAIYDSFPETLKKVIEEQKNRILQDVDDSKKK